MTIPKQEKRFDYKGFPCVVLFMPAGYRCGYAGIKKGNKYYGAESYDDIPVTCHCGLTYANYSLHNQNDEDVFWIGFDCAHACDGLDVAKIKELYADDESVMKQTAIMESIGYFEIYKGYPVRTLEYCEEQCRGIVEQLIKLGIGKEVAE